MTFCIFTFWDALVLEMILRAFDRMTLSAFNRHKPSYFFEGNKVESWEVDNRVPSSEKMSRRRKAAEGEMPWSRQ